jgi:hypothetical protein
LRIRQIVALSTCLFTALLLCAPLRAGNLRLSPEAAHALEQIYGGDPDAAIVTIHQMERAQPDSPVGYLLEDEALWWKAYCAACEIKWGILDASKRPKEPADDTYFALADKAIDLAHAQIAKSDTAEPHVYAAIGLALKARLYGLRDQKRDVAHAGVAARAECVRALQLDPDMADATAGLGLYNYYVDTLGGIAKMLRFFMGIPGGDKEEGIRQMNIGIDRGAFLSVGSRFYLAKNLRTYDQQYAEALTVAQPLIARYPHNLVFLLLLGNLNAEMGHQAEASGYFRAAQSTTIPDSVCTARIHELAASFLTTPH